MPKTKKRFHLTWRRALAFLALCALVMFSRLAQVPAQSVIQGYNSDQSLQPGMLVSTDTKDGSKVSATSSENLDQLRGVVVDPSAAAVTLSSPDQKVFIASSGHFSALVSNQNGAVHTNDYISISSLPGIGMRAQAGQKVVLGRALSNFDGNKDVVSTASVKEGNSTKQVALGKIVVDIVIVRNPVTASSSVNLPGFLQGASTSIAGKTVSTGKVYLGAIILLMSGIVSGSMLYAGVRSSIVSIGRNPLSKGSIVRSLIQVVIISLIIFVGGLFGVYLLLKL